MSYPQLIWHLSYHAFGTSFSSCPIVVYRTRHLWWWCPLQDDMFQNPVAYTFFNALHEMYLHWILPKKLPTIMQAPLDRHSPNPTHWWDEWKSAPVVISALVDDPTIRQPGFDLPRHCWKLLNCFQTDHGHCASCERSGALHAATDMCPCGKCQTMWHIVNSCPQSKLEGAAAIALSWWRCYQMAEDTQLVNALDNNNEAGYVCVWHSTVLHCSAIIIIIIQTFVTRTLSANILNLRCRQSLGEEDGGSEV